MRCPTHRKPLAVVAAAGQPALMQTAPLLRVLSLLALLAGGFAGFQVYGLAGVIAAVVTAAWFLAAAEALTYLREIASNTRRPAAPPVVAPASVPTAAELAASVKAMESVRRQA